ncbi:MAG: hypothetical protein Rubg2KO_35260 [Rubricoccaceae bacterium]
MTNSPALTRIDAPNAAGVPVLAYALSGRLTEDDIDRLHADLDRQGRARLLIRADAFEMPKPGALARQLAGLGRFLGSLERYAVVGGPEWLRGYAAVGGALAPFPVRHFDDEAAARDWIASPATADEIEDRQEAAVKAAPAVTQLDTDRPDLVALAVDGHLTADDYKRVVDPAIELALRDHDEIDLLMRLDDLDGVSLGAAKEDAALAKHIGRFRRMALVGGPGWLTSLVDTLGALMPTEVEAFETEAEARDWLGGTV